MTIYSFKDISSSVDRHKLYILFCKPEEVNSNIGSIQSYKIATINLGKELATFIDHLDDYQYLNIDVYDYTKKLLDRNKSKINGSGNEIVAIYNLGILLEPALELNPVHLLEEYSKSSALIIIWENKIDISDKLIWPSQNSDYCLDFSDTHLKTLQNVI